MLPNDGAAVCKQPAEATPLEKLLRVLSVVTMAMTVPQVIAVWTQPNVGGVSLVSWATYLVAAVAWLVYGIQKRDRTIYLACIGWITLDAAIVAGLIVRH